MHTAAKALLALAALLPAAPAHAQPCEPELLARLTGYANDVAVDGDTAYLANGRGGLLVLDIATPDSPSVIGSLQINGLEGAALDEACMIEVAGDTAFLALNTGAILLIDIATPESPNILSTLDLGDEARWIESENDVLYVGNQNGVRWFDISVPENPSPRDSITEFPPRLTNVVDVDVEDGTVYVLGQRATQDSPPQPVTVNDVFLAYDANSPDQPIIDENLQNHAEDMLVRGDTVYLSGLYIQIVDVSNPAKIATLFAPNSSALPFTTEVIGFRGSRLLVYKKEGLNEFLDIEVGDPSAPTTAAAYPDFQRISADARVLAGNSILLCDDGALFINDASVPGEFAHLAAIRPSVRAHDILVDDGYAYIVGEGLMIVDVSDPENPIATGHVDDIFGQRLAKRGPLLAIGSGATGTEMHIVDVSDPHSPALLETIDFSGLSLDVEFTEDVLVAGTYRNRFEVFNVDNPNDIQHIASVPIDGIPFAIENIGDTIYVSMSGELRIFSAISPELYFPVGSVTIGGVNLDLELEDGLAWLAGNTGDLTLVDISDPSKPSIVSAYKADGLIERIAVSGRTGYIVDRTSTDSFVRVIDATNGESPNLIGSARSSAGLRAAAPMGDTLLATGVTRELLSYDISTCAPTPADLNGDGAVGSPDLGILLAAWGQADSPADLDGDGVVGSPDLGILLAAWNG